jgi:hypothetical protein
VFFFGQSSGTVENRTSMSIFDAVLASVWIFDPRRVCVFVSIFCLAVLEAVGVYARLKTIMKHPNALNIGSQIPRWDSEAWGMRGRNATM